MYGPFSSRLISSAAEFTLEDLGNLIHAYYILENGGAAAGVPNQKIGGLAEWDLAPVTTQGVIVPDATPTGYAALRTNGLTTQYKTGAFAFAQPYEVFSVFKAHELVTLGMMLDGRTDVSCTIRVESSAQTDSSFGGAAIDQNVNTNFEGANYDRFWLFHHIADIASGRNEYRINNYIKFNVDGAGNRSPNGFVVGNRGLGTQPKDCSLVALVIAGSLTETQGANVRSVLYPSFENRFLSLAQGDSITEGFGTAPSWIAELTSTVTDRMEFVNKATGGNTITSDILPNLQTLALDYYDAGRKGGLTHAPFWAGTNDIFLSGLSAETVFDNFVSAANILKASGIVPIPFNCLERPASANPALQAQRTLFNTLLQNNFSLIGPTLIDVTNVLGPSPGPDWQDGIHPTTQGIQALTTQRIEPGLRAVLGV